MKENIVIFEQEVKVSECAFSHSFIMISIYIIEY